MALIDTPGTAVSESSTPESDVPKSLDGLR